MTAVPNEQGTIHYEFNQRGRGVFWMKDEQRRTLNFEVYTANVTARKLQHDEPIIWEEHHGYARLDSCSFAVEFSLTL